MTWKRGLVAVAGALLALSSLALWAQDKPKEMEEAKEPGLVMVHVDHVKPSMVKEYKQAALDMVALMKEEKLDSPLFDFYGFKSDSSFTYSYASPVRNMADMDAMYEEWMKLVQGPDKAKWEALEKRMGATLTCMDRIVAMRVDKASYHPEKPRLDPGEAKYRYYDYFYVQPGKEKDFVHLCGQLAGVAAKGGFTDPWTVYSVIVGQKMPLFVIVSIAKDQGDYGQAMKDFSKAVGDEGKKLMAGIMDITRKYKGEGQWYVPSLSYRSPSSMPEKKEMKK